MEIPNHYTNSTTFMEALALAFFSQWELIHIYPPLVMALVGLAGCLIMW